jgi:hypothetical protein
MCQEDRRESEKGKVEQRAEYQPPLWLRAVAQIIRPFL